MGSNYSLRDWMLFPRIAMNFQPQILSHIIVYISKTLMQHEAMLLIITICRKHKLAPADISMSMHIHYYSY